MTHGGVRIWGCNCAVRLSTTHSADVTMPVSNSHWTTKSIRVNDADALGGFHETPISKAPSRSLCRFQ